MDALCLYSVCRQVDEILRLDNLMFVNIDRLDKCEYRMDAFAELLAEAQKIIDEFCLHDFSNFPSWIGIIDGKVERKLFDRLQTAIGLWREALIRQEKGKSKEKKRMHFKVTSFEALPVSVVLVCQ